MSIDASSTCIGWSIFEDDDLITYGKILPTIKDLDWRERLQDFIPQLHEIMKAYKPKKMYIEDVPLMKKGGLNTLVILGAIQGMLLGICCSHSVDVEFIPVATWRKNIGLFDGTAEGKERNMLKQHSIEKANKLFGLDLVYVSPSSKKNDDDISDSILIYSSTRPKYQSIQQEIKHGRKAKV